MALPAKKPELLAHHYTSSQPVLIRPVTLVLSADETQVILDGLNSLDRISEFLERKERIMYTSIRDQIEPIINRNKRKLTYRIKLRPHEAYVVVKCLGYITQEAQSWRVSTARTLIQKIEPQLP